MQKCDQLRSYLFTYCGEKTLRRFLPTVAGTRVGSLVKGRFLFQSSNSVDSAYPMAEAARGARVKGSFYLVTKD